MERYTYFENGKWCLRIGDTEHSGPWIDRLAAYEDTGLEPEDIKAAFNEEAVLKLAAQALGTTPDRLRELVKAQDEGQVLMLPCKVGDTVWVAKAIFTNYQKPKAETVIGFAYPWHDPSGDLLLVCCKGGRKFTADQIGDIAFLTRAEAEAALGGGGDG